MSEQSAATPIAATVRIAFEDADGRHEVDDQVTVMVSTEEQFENLRRLVDQGILDAQLPGQMPTPVIIPQPGEQSALPDPEPTGAPNVTEGPGANFPEPTLAPIPESEPTAQPELPDDAFSGEAGQG